MDQWQSLQRLRGTIDEAIAIVEDNNVDEHSLQEVEERISADSKERTIVYTVCHPTPIVFTLVRPSFPPPGV